MEIKQNILTKNNCYKAGARLIPKMLMVHSTACKGVPAKNFIKSWNTPAPNGREVCVHGFTDDTGAYQTLPWDIQAWHCGGSGNQKAIGIELCEPSNYGDKAYFNKVIEIAIQEYAYLAKKYNIPVSKIVSHKEGHSMGIASNHGDPDHWWSHVGYTMDNFRADVQECINSGKVNVTTGGGISVDSSESSSESWPTIHFKYRVRTKEDGWLPEVVNLADYAGIKGHAITDVAIGVDQGSLWYQVHVKGGGWLPKVTGYNTGDYNNGYAGNGKPIDAIRVYYNTPADYIKKYGYQKAQYRVSPLNGNYWPWQYDNETGVGQDGYAGVFGRTIDKFQLF